MSNALCLLDAGGPSAAAAIGVSPGGSAHAAEAAALTPSSLPVTLVAMGLCTLLVWLIRRAARPGKLTLTHTPGRPNFLNPAHIILVLMVWVAVHGAAFYLLRPLFGKDAVERRLLENLAVQLGSLGASLCVGALAFRFGLRRGMGLTLRHWLYDSARAIVGFFAVWPVCVGLLSAFRGLAPPGQEEHVMLTALAALAGWWKVLVIFTAVAVAPVAEELFYRGLLQSMIRRYTRVPWVGVAVAAALFAFSHQPYWHHMPALFVLAVALGYNYERCGRLWAPILLHALFNAANIVVFLLPVS